MTMPLYGEDAEPAPLVSTIDIEVISADTDAIGARGAIQTSYG